MRLVDYVDLPQASGILTGLDGFAELAGGLDADLAIGGFRIMRPRASQRARIKARLLRRTADMHLRANSSLSILFMGGLALAGLAGPASCPCDPLHAAPPLSAGGDGRALSLFAYTRASDIGLARAPAAQRWEGPLIELATLLNPEPSAQAQLPSPIETGAIPTASTSRAPLRGLARLGALPSKIDNLAAITPEPIRLAAVAPAADVPVPLLPVINVSTPDQLATASEADEAHTTHQRTVSKRRRSRSRARRARRARSSDPAVIAAQKHARAPRWAQQMFDNPWQSKAFSYIR
jgi:hypothetical protein